MHRSGVERRGRAGDLFKSFREMRLVGKSHIQRHLRDGRSEPQELSGLGNSDLGQIGMRRQSKVFREESDKMIETDAGGLRCILEADVVTSAGL